MLLILLYIGNRKFYLRHILKNILTPLVITKEIIDLVTISGQQVSKNSIRPPPIITPILAVTSFVEKSTGSHINYTLLVPVD